MFNINKFDKKKGGRDRWDNMTKCSCYETKIVIVHIN